MTEPPPGWLTGEQAAQQTGKSIAEIDQAALVGDIPAAYWGWQLLVSAPDTPGAGVDEVQHIAIIGSPNSGLFRLESGGQWTTNVAYHPSAIQIQNALTALLGAGNVAVTKPGSWDY